MTVPSNIVIPFFGLSFDGSQAGAESSTVPVKQLIISQRTSSGIVDEGIIYQPTTAAEAATNSGFGSMAHMDVELALRNNKTVPLYVITLDDAATATSATHSFDVTGTATEAGEMASYVDGKRYAVPVASGDANTAVLAALLAAYNADTNNMPSTASVATSTLTHTMKNAGVAAGDLDIRFSANRGEKVPAGLTVSAVTTVAGTVDPDLGVATAALGSEWYNVISQPFTDNTNLGVMEEYLDSVADVMEQREAVCYQAMRDTRANMITFGLDTANRNNKWMVTLPAYKRRQSTHCLAAMVAAQSAVSIQERASTPLHRMTLVGCDALDEGDKWTATERNQLALSGISTLTDEIGVQTEATVTMYLKNSAGADDTAYQQQNTLYTLSALRYRFKNQILTKYPRALLADAADNIGDGIQVMTLDTARVEAVNWFTDAQQDGLVDSSAAALTQFKNDLAVARVGANRMEWSLPPDLMNQFIVGAGTIYFRQ